MTATRDERRRSFDAIAERYAVARPGYPAALFDELTRLVPPPADVLEVGPGPGQATIELARRGYRITAVELGERMAEVARGRLAGYPSVRIVHADFHDWEPAPGAFDLVFAASAFHWIEPHVGYPKAFGALRPGGWLALAWNHGIRGTGPPARFWDATDRLYRRLAPAIAHGRHGPGQGSPDPDPRVEITASGLFGPVRRRSWRWGRDFSAEEYVALLGTYSDHLTLPADERGRLLEAVAELIERRFGGSIRREYRTLLYAARREPVRRKSP